MVSFTQGSDPGVATYDQEGRFAFTNIVPGTYALVNWTPVSSFVVEAPTGGLIKVVVEAGKTTDLGTIVVP